MSTREGWVSNSEGRLERSARIDDKRPHGLYCAAGQVIEIQCRKRWDCPPAASFASSAAGDRAGACGINSHGATLISQAVSYGRYWRKGSTTAR
jgi:hypothetical protein